MPKHLLSYDTDTDEVEISDGTWRPLTDQENNRLYGALSYPSPWWLDFGAVALVIAVAALLIHGGGKP